MDDIMRLAERLKKLDDSFGRAAGRRQTLSETLESFRQISRDYGDMHGHEEDDTYSSADFTACTQEERGRFTASELMQLQCLVTQDIRQSHGTVMSWADIFGLIRDPEYAKTEKSARRVVFSTESTARPVGDVSYGVWNGLQIIDVDIKDRALALRLKPALFRDLCMYGWFLGCAVSASGKSLHIWTKMTPMTQDPDNRRVEYLCNFRHKYSYVYIALLKHMKEMSYDRDMIFTFLDMAMAKPQQGIFVTSDPAPLMNTGFRDRRLDVDFSGAFDTGIESVDWISHPDLKSVFARLEWFNRPDRRDEAPDAEAGPERDPKKAAGRRHYRHAQRWQLANTLTKLYGPEKALDLMCAVCEGTPRQELQGDVRTAAVHDKPVSVWAAGELNRRHGFSIRINTDNIYEDRIRAIEGEPQEDKGDSEGGEKDLQGLRVQDPVRVLNDRTERVSLHLRSDQYLSDIQQEIMDNLSHITLLEAGAGYGKTEMVKALKAKTLLILPFTSTIRAKVESSETTKDWLYFYGNKRPELEDILGSRSMSMTVDKFSRLNIMELDQAGFEYIVLDESHLLFTSGYRDVMAPAIQRLANCRAKVIMMTGTPTGELLFFPEIRHIKVVKDDLRRKTFTVHLCPGKEEQTVEMCRRMTEDVMEGRKILFPTNKGNLWFEQVSGLVQEYLTEAKWPRPLKAFYYKKSNFNDTSMDRINVGKTIGDNDIVFCTTYLSVGVDICDEYRFSVYFNEPWIPQDIEQFANRLRNNDLYVSMYLPKEDKEGMPINWFRTEPLDLSTDRDSVLFVRDLVRACNDMLDRNREDSRYNPIISQMIQANRFLRYDESDCRYYVDETQYKLKLFEDRYSDFSKQLTVMEAGMRYYGYEVTTCEHNDRIPEDRLDELESYMKGCRQARYDYTTVQTMKFLDTLDDGTLDVYRDVLKGDYSVFRTDTGQGPSAEDAAIYTDDIEIVEKNIPIVLGLHRFYDCPTIRDIFTYCVDGKSRRINYAKLERIRRFVGIEYQRRKKRLDLPVARVIRDMHDWANENPEPDCLALEEWQQKEATRYANTISGVVVEDIAFQKAVYEWYRDLFRVCVVQERPRNGKVRISPLNLLWDRRKGLDGIYGKDDPTAQFFLQELTDNMDADKEQDEPEPPMLTVTPKRRLKDISDELPGIIHTPYAYTEYSEEDGSNGRFRRRQENTRRHVAAPPEEKKDQGPKEPRFTFTEA